MLNDFAQAVEPETFSIRDLNNDDDIKEISSKFDYTVVSFFKPSDAKSVEVDGFMDGAQAFFNLKIEQKYWDPRNVGWLRVDIENNPDSAMSDTSD